MVRSIIIIHIAFLWGNSCLYFDKKYKCESFAVHYATLTLNYNRQRRKTAVNYITHQEHMKDTLRYIHIYCRHMGEF